MATARKRAHRFTDDGAAPDIVALFWVLVGEPDGEDAAQQVKSIVRQVMCEGTGSAVHTILDYTRVYQIVLTFVYAEMKAMQAQQGEAREAAARGNNPAERTVIMPINKH